eukprot:283695_1
MKHLKKEYEDEDDRINKLHQLKDEAEINKQWFKNCYHNLLKWQEIGADMSVVSEDGLCPLLTYVNDTNNEDIDMNTIKLFCPTNGVGFVTGDNDEKYELKYDQADNNIQNGFYVDKEIREKAFNIWYHRHSLKNKLFDIQDIKIWHGLDATYNLKTLKPTLTYLTLSEIDEQKIDDIDALIECGDIFENIDDLCNNESAKINLDIIQYLHDKYNVPITLNSILHENVKDVTESDTYTTPLAKYIKQNRKVNLNCIKHMIKMGFIITTNDNSQKYIRDSVTNPSLPFQVLQFLLDNFAALNTNEENKLENEFDNEILNSWIRINEHVTLDQIKTLIDRYGFSPYVSNNGTECAIHYVWENKKIPFAVMHDCWNEYGKKKFGSVYEEFFFEILEKRKIKTIEEMQYLETVFSQFVDKIDEITGNTMVHTYCKNKHLKLSILQYICQKYQDQLLVGDKNGDKPIHSLCNNAGLTLMHLQYFVEGLKIPMNTEALHYLLDNESVIWNRRDMHIMIHKLNIDFETRRAGEIILYQISKLRNWTIEALIHLYNHYKDKLDLNALKSAKEMGRDKTIAAGTTILMNLLQQPDITPNQIIRLVEHIGLDIKAKDNNNENVLHTIAQASLTAMCLRTVGRLYQKILGDEFVVDCPNNYGAMPFQKWLHAKKSFICMDMDVVATWEDLGADISRPEHGGANNMLHYALSGDSSYLRLAYLRKMCFDHEDPWKANEKNNYAKSVKKQKENKSIKFQLPLHVKPIANNSTLFRIYVNAAIHYNEPININVLEYFRSKKQDGVRVVLDTTESVLWLYMKHKHIKLNVVKYLIEDMGCSIQPYAAANIAMRYMTFLSQRDKIDWDILDYFYTELKVDFKFIQGDYTTILHEYNKKVKIFNCDEFTQLIERYDLVDILHEKRSISDLFDEIKSEEIRPDIIKCFVNLGYNLYELIRFNAESEDSAAFNKTAYISIEVQFVANEKLSIFASEANILHVIESYVDNQYVMKINDMSVNNVRNVFTILLSIEYNYKENKFMEIYIEEKLFDVNFSKQLLEFSNQKHIEILPIIKINGKTNSTQISDYQKQKQREFVERYYRNQKNQVIALQKNLFNDITPLNQMTSNDISDMIRFWLMNDAKNTAHNKLVMKAIIENNINGNFVTQLLSKNFSLKTTLHDVVGSLINETMMEEIANKLSHVESKSLSQMNSASLAQLICDFATNEIQTQLADKFEYISGNWLVNTRESEKQFLEIIYAIAAVDEDDGNQIYNFLKQYDAPTDESIKQQIFNAVRFSNIIMLSDDDLSEINLAKLAIKLKNNWNVSVESQKILNLFYHLIRKQKTESKPNYDLITELYKLFSNVFSEISHNWWCSECCYNNRIIQINGQYLTSDHHLMRNCIVCGYNKVDAINNHLKNKTQQNYLMNTTRDTDDKMKLNCHDNVSKCEYCQMLLTFLQNYHKHKQLDYAETLKKLNKKDVLNNIFLQALEFVNNKTEKETLINEYKHEIEKMKTPNDAKNIQNEKEEIKINNEEYDEKDMSFEIDGKKLCEMTRNDFKIMILSRNENISVGTIELLYDLLFEACNKYVSKQRSKVFGDSGSCLGILICWKHALQNHFNNKQCDQNVYKCIDKQCDQCKHKVNRCNNANCSSKTRQTQSRRDRKNGIIMISKLKHNNNYNAYIQQEIQNDALFQAELDNIHLNVLHKETQKINMSKIKTMTKAHGLLKENDDDDDIDDD